jgi:hypothetical protein
MIVSAYVWTTCCLLLATRVSVSPHFTTSIDTVQSLHGVRMESEYKSPVY